ncbi:minichromosome instability 12 (mis12)-like protein [Wolffia australiana]
MEGSESEAVFDAYNLKPQLFINEVLNVVDDLVDDAFDFCREHASALVGGDKDGDRSEELQRGISSLHRQTRATLNKRLDLWERYCLLHCFSVPEEFSSNKTTDTSDDFTRLRDALHDGEQDAQLLSLRQKLAAVSQECASRQREVNALGKRSSQSSGHHPSVNDVIRLLDDGAASDIFNEVGDGTARLRSELKSLLGGSASPIAVGFLGDASRPTDGDIFSKLEDLQKAADTLRLFRKP